jgi:excinuclease ABC subunit C
MPDLSKIPKDPGVYIFKDRSGKIIYIGKAKQLRNRVSSYFHRSDSPKTQVLAKLINDIDFIAVDNEVEALLLENRLIKQHTPRFNIMLKDSKTYAYIKITNEKFPRILSVRKVSGGGQYFGPYVDGLARKELLALAIKLFRLRVCDKLPKRACLNYYIGTCTAPCIQNASKDEYMEQVRGASEFLKGETGSIQKKLEIEMKEASRGQKYEIALEKRRQIDAVATMGTKQRVDLVKRFDQDVIAFDMQSGKVIVSLFSISKGVIRGKKEFSFEAGIEKENEAIESFIKLYYSSHYIPREILVNTEFWADVSGKKVVEGYLEKIRGTDVRITCPTAGEKLSLMQLAEKNLRLRAENKALTELQQKLTLPSMPITIEVFDASNLGYDYLVGAMTRWIGGFPDKSSYRKFKIKSVLGKNDDYASIREIVFRRYKRLAEEGVAMPDLILIDGGPGQLDAALDSLKKLGQKIPIISLAKQNEEIYLPGQQEPLKYDKNSDMMLLVRRMRDSVHQMAIAYNRKRRQMAMRDEVREIK